MGDADLIVAIVALVFSVIVGLVITSQLLAQIFSTAEGQRKCSSSLLGLWSEDPTTETRRKWRWSEARFETKFVIPEIFLDTSAIQDESDDALHKDRGQIWSRFFLENGTKMSSKRKTMSVLGADVDLDYILFICTFAEDAPDMVSWLNFLAFLRLETRHAKIQTLPNEPSEKSNASTSSPGRASEPQIDSLELSWPRIKYRLHSWDFMPPNAPKPFAKITIHDLAVLARRTGMVWKTFDVKNGNMSAEGGSHILTGTLIQGMGLVLEYRCLDEKRLARGVWTEIKAIRQKTEKTFTPHQKIGLDKARANAFGRDEANSHNSDEESQNKDSSDDDPQDERDRKDQRVTVWVKAMDKFIFGLIPADPRLGLPDFPFAGEEDCFHSLETLFNDTIRTKIWNPRWPFNDLIYVAPPVLRIRHGERTALRFKSKAECASIFSDNLSLLAFGVLLRAYLNGGTTIYESEVIEVKSFYPDLPKEKFDMKMLGKLLRGREDGGTEQMKKILRRVEKLVTDSRDKVMPGNEAPRLLEELHDDHDSTTQYFIDNKDRIRFYDLLKAHFSKTTLAGRDAQSTEKEYKFALLDEEPSLSIMEMYFSYIPDYVNFVKTEQRYNSGPEGCADEDLVIEAWLTMMWRGYLFRFLHTFEFDFKGIYVPSEYYGSRLPVSLV